MTTELKQQIVAAALKYCSEKGISNNELSRQTNINAGYLSQMMRGIFTFSGADIADRWFAQLAQFVGISFKKTYWETMPVLQFQEMLTTLEASKEGGKTAMIIGPTGYTKTYSIDKFCHIYPLHTYRITVSSLYKLEDIVNELADKVGIEYNSNNAIRINALSLKRRVDKIVEKLVEINRNGGKPIVIFDEGENLEMAVLKMLKALYDGLKDYCSIVIIGTEQLLNKLLNLRKRNRDAIPQLYRRFKAGQKIISPIVKARDFKPFYDKYVQEKGLQTLLSQICDNYGELHDYLEPALREADERGEQLTENFFRLKYNMPK